MRKLICLLLLSVPCAAQTWRYATDVEINAESQKQLEWMGKIGLIGDPPCTVGLAFWVETGSYEYLPCALTDSRGNFRDLVRVKAGGKVCLMTVEQDTKWRAKHTENYLQDVFDDCAKGTLPKFEIRK